MPKKKFKKILKGSDAIIKLAAPKVVTAGVNIMYLGPRIILRSTVQLLRTNLLTRILSCITILIIDVYDLSRKRISRSQFMVNLVLSLLLVVSGTIGWEFGRRWLVFEAIGGFADIIGSIIGAAIVVFVSNFAFDRACNKLIESDAKKMWKIIDPYIQMLPHAEQDPVRSSITNSCLKKMFACEDRQAFAQDLVNTLHEMAEVI